jgi:hypothetical protein
VILSSNLPKKKTPRAINNEILACESNHFGFAGFIFFKKNSSYLIPNIALIWI